MDSTSFEPTAMDDLPPYLTIEQMAKVLQIGRTKAYELVALWERTGGADGLPCIRIGFQRRVPRDVLKEHLDERVRVL